MITLSAQDLNNYGAQQSSSTLTFMGKVFVRGQSFSSTMREQATKIAEQNLQRGRPCLLVESDTETTVWVEMQNHPPASPPKENVELDIDSGTEQPSGLTYRGQPVATPPINSPSNTSTNTISTEGASIQPETHAMSYRGQIFEVPMTTSTSESSSTKAPASSDNTNISSDARSPIPSSPLKRKIQYRGQWIEVD